MSHEGGGGALKVRKKCHVLFEWPLIAKEIFLLNINHIAFKLKNNNPCYFIKLEFNKILNGKYKRIDFQS